ncbi:MAG: phage/plasmid primase, P4 family [Candidatus Bathyarchaeia archaeon]
MLKMGTLPQEKLDVVKQFYDAGFTPLPLKPNAKEPAMPSWGDWQTRRPLWDEIEASFVDAFNRFGDTNIGLLCGKLHGNLVVLDIDDPNRFREFVKQKELILPRTPIVKTRKGFHLYFRYPDGIEIRRFNRINEFGAELRGDGHYVVAPPSVVDGKVYQFLQRNGRTYDLSLSLADIPVTLLDELMKTNSVRTQPVQLPSTNGSHLTPEVVTAVKVLLVPHWTEGNRHDLSLYLAGWLAKEGYAYDEVEGLILEIADAAGDDEVKDRLQAVRDTYNKALNGNEVKGWQGLTEKLDNGVLEALRGLLSKKVQLNGNGDATFDRPEKPTTDLGNAERLVRLFGNRLKYVPQWGWLIWDGRRWLRDRGNIIVTQFAEETVKTIYQEAAKATDPNERVKLAKWAIASENRQRIYAMIELAAPMVRDEAENFDRDPYLLNCLNGVLDLRTGELKPHDPELRLTKLCPVNYNPDADAPTWLKFLSDIFCGDQDLIAYVQRALGYSLTGDVCEDVMFICWGSGSNGKTTLFKVVSEILGDYAKSIVPDALLRKNQQSDSHPTTIADLCGVRLAIAQETDEGRHLAAARVKALTGKDKVKARFMRQDYFEFNPTHKIWLATNHKPIISDTTYAMWRRIQLIPFRAFFDETRQDKKMPEKLLAEKEGILAWMVKGCLEWQRQGLNPPKVVREATKEYQTEMDKVQAWLESCCVVVPEAVTPFADLYASYENWCKENSEEPMSKHAFGNRLTEKGFNKVKIGGVAGRRGLMLKDDDYSKSEDGDTRSLDELSDGDSHDIPTADNEPTPTEPLKFVDTAKFFDDITEFETEVTIEPTIDPVTDTEFKPIGQELTTPNFPHGRSDAVWLSDIKKWMSVKFNCPVCRRPLVQDDRKPDEPDVWRCLNPRHCIEVKDGTYYVDDIPNECCVEGCKGRIAITGEDKVKCNDCGTRYRLMVVF